MDGAVVVFDDLVALRHPGRTSVVAAEIGGLEGVLVDGSGDLGNSLRAAFVVNLSVNSIGLGPDESALEDNNLV